MKAVAPLAVLTALLIGCASVAEQETTTVEEEPVYSVSATKAGLAVRVASNGCTKAEDFDVIVDKSGGFPVVSLVRIREDPCRAFAIGGTVVTFDYEKIGLSGEFKLANRLVRWNGPGE